jgi:hypothetical protein
MENQSMLTKHSRFRPLKAAILAALVLAPSMGGAQVLGPPPAQPAPTAQPASQDWRAVLSALKIRPTGALERRKHHSEVEGVTEAGRTVTVSLDPQGRIWEIEDENHERPEGVLAMPNGQAAVDAVRRAGFANPVLAETKRRHSVVRAATAAGEAVDLHVDAASYIYKQVWVRR